MHQLLGRFLGVAADPAEVNDGVPIAPAIDEAAPESMEEMIRRFIRQEVSSDAEEEGFGSFDDEDDFEDEEDADVLPLTHHEVIGMSEDELRGVAAAYGVEIAGDPLSVARVPQETVPEASAEAQTASSARPPDSPPSPS